MFAVLLGFLILTDISRAQEPCFDFEHPIIKPLRPPIPMKKKGDARASGKLQAGGGWAAARGKVQHPIGEVLQRILDPSTIKDTKKAHIEVKRQQRTGYYVFETFSIDSKPAPFVSLQWEEDWGFVIAQGTPEKPEEVVISYEKTSGTDYIHHLCGSIVLRALGASATDVYLYEEIDATGRSPEDSLKGHLGTLRTLRRPPPRE